jgi:adenylate cyclase
LELGIGLHTGEAVVGNIGSESRMDYTVVGDVVNVAKGLQEKAGGTEILLSTTTYDQVKGIELGDPEAIHLPGRQEPIMAYRLDRGLIECTAKSEGKG